LKKLLLLLALFNLLTGYICAQTQPFGIIDTADLKTPTCDFEKDANAIVLFDQAVVTTKGTSIIMERHKRIKIFNDKGKDEANIRIEYYGAHRDEEITDVEAETINLDGKIIEHTAVDKKLIYTEATDKQKKAIVFTFPNVRAGSVIEFKYKWSTPYPYNYPDWFFQTSIPTRYSEFDAGFSNDFLFTLLKKTYQPLYKDTAMILGTKVNPWGTRHIWAMSNIKTFKEEPFMDYPEDYFQCILLKTYYPGRSWIKIADQMLDDIDFGEQLTKSPGNQDEIIAKANLLKTDDEKIAYLFNTVKTAMKWNKIDAWYTMDGVKKAWNKKTGNSTEINLILYNLLQSANVKALLMSLSTRDNGKLQIDYPSFGQLNKTVVYCPVDSSKYYVLDATSPYNSYNNTPLDLIGLYALSMDAVNKKYTMFPLKNGSTREIILVSGSIGTDGKLEGTTQISGSGYSREKYLKQYNDLGEKKYIDQMQKDNSSLKITAFKLENPETDSLPLTQSFDFSYNLTEPDGDYMYFNPNVLTGFQTNPFLSETRVSNIDFGCLYNYSINGRYKIPAGYKVDALPKQVIMHMPDNDIVFRRVAAEQDGYIIIHYTINYKRSVFSKDEYSSIRDFYKKMYEMLNEQVVLKKS
jgi:hypothetical protein